MNIIHKYEEEAKIKAGDIILINTGRKNKNFLVFTDHDGFYNLLDLETFKMDRGGFEDEIELYNELHHLIINIFPSSPSNCKDDLTTK